MKIKTKKKGPARFVSLITLSDVTVHANGDISGTDGRTIHEHNKTDRSNQHYKAGPYL